MVKPSVSVPQYRALHDKPFGPAMIEHRTADCGLDELGTYVMVFNSDEPSEPWTLQYEETLYVAAGEARIHVIDGDDLRVVTASAGELIVIPRGTTVRYAASVGTRLVLSITPVDWRSRTR
jgi:ethanolamine utilization protein EutQ (cupin superfamily)